jgi:deoxycytidylate deaminase
VIHAEISAILSCLRSNHRPRVLYVTKPPCVRCAGVIIASGMRYVTFPQRDKASTWADSQQKAIELFLEANIYVNEVEHGL